MTVWTIVCFSVLGLCVGYLLVMGCIVDPRSEQNSRENFGGNDHD